MISPSDHEEADTRSMLHAAHMKQQGFNSIVLKTNKTDVLILSTYTQANLGFNEFWLPFGVGRSHKFIPVHDIVPQIGRSQALALPGFHAFTGCDVNSSIHSKGKKTCWVSGKSIQNSLEHSILCPKLVLLKTMSMMRFHY